jgi:hypothetical protein
MILQYLRKTDSYYYLIQKYKCRYFWSTFISRIGPKVTEKWQEYVKKKQL